MEQIAFFLASFNFYGDLTAAQAAVRSGVVKISRATKITEATATETLLRALMNSQYAHLQAGDPTKGDSARVVEIAYWESIKLSEIKALVGRLLEDRVVDPTAGDVLCEVLWSLPRSVPFRSYAVVAADGTPKFDANLTLALLPRPIVEVNEQVASIEFKNGLGQTIAGANIALSYKSDGCEIENKVEGKAFHTMVQSRVSQTALLFNTKVSWENYEHFQTEPRWRCLSTPSQTNTQDVMLSFSLVVVTTGFPEAVVEVETGLSFEPEKFPLKLSSKIKASDLRRVVGDCKQLRFQIIAKADGTVGPVGHDSPACL